MIQIYFFFLLFGFCFTSNFQETSIVLLNNVVNLSCSLNSNLESYLVWFNKARCLELRSCKENSLFTDTSISNITGLNFTGVYYIENTTKIRYINITLQVSQIIYAGIYECVQFNNGDSNTSKSVSLKEVEVIVLESLPSITLLKNYLTENDNITLSCNLNYLSNSTELSLEWQDENNISLNQNAIENVTLSKLQSNLTLKFMPQYNNKRFKCLIKNSTFYSLSETVQVFYNNAALIGGLLGGIAILLIIIISALIVFFYKRNSKSKNDTDLTNPYYGFVFQKGLERKESPYKVSSVTTFEDTYEGDLIIPPTNQAGEDNLPPYQEIYNLNCVDTLEPPNISVNQRSQENSSQYQDITMGNFENDNKLKPANNLSEEIKKSDDTQYEEIPINQLDNCNNILPPISYEITYAKIKH